MIKTRQHITFNYKIRVWLPKLYTALFILFAITNSNAQSNCSETLKTAEKNYDQGKIEGIPESLSDCLKKGLSSEEKIRAYKLIINAHIFNENLQKAEKSMLNFLKFNPEYQPSLTTDKAEFISIYNKYETKPIFSLGIMAGLNSASINVINEYNTSSTTSYKYPTDGIGYQAVIQAIKPLKQNFELSLGIGIQNNKYNYKCEALDFSLVTLEQKQTMLYVPISVLYTYKFKNIHPFAFGGLGANYTLATSGTPTRIYTDNSNDDIAGTDIDMIEMRNKLGISAIMGLGVRYKITKGYFFFNAQYQLGMTNVANPDNRYSNKELNYVYHYIDSDFSLNSFSFSIGYTYMFYKPSRKTN